MSELDNAIKKIGSLDAAIENALNNEVAEVVKKALTKAARELVYDAYTPIFNSRRNGNGGILDPNSVHVEAHGNELIAIDTVAGVKGGSGWQQLWGGNVPTERLADAIASGDRRFNMHRAGPRPFHEQAKKEMIQSGELEIALRAGLQRQGIDTSEMKFKFI